ncbi:hypothetical protein F443_16604 [Phytophthora nicotianae P1569]|uniref:Uncharacterized protein n=1 Tax=Phytophthora nicotianae P1569 TaxID=1317065 RepID=V9EDZ4_PHYNI|nr:hypothetical protein F443_16604 [Phytophthora nicotianae P1569]
MGNFAKNLILSHENNPQVKRPECARRLMYTAVAKKSPPIENIKEHLPSCKTEGSSSAQTKARGGIMGPIGMGISCLMSIGHVPKELSQNAQAKFTQIPWRLVKLNPFSTRPHRL